MKSNQWLRRWLDLDSRTKWLAIGTVAVVVASICLSFSNCSAAFNQPNGQQSGGQGSGLIDAKAKPIPLATEDTKMATSLMDILSNENCLWKATDDELCGLEFTADGFTEYNGDIATTATVEFYEISASKNGRDGVWRVLYEDGSVVDATFSFTQDLQSGRYTIHSDAFPTYKSFQTKSFSGQDQLLP